MHLVIACLCNARITIPATAGHAAAWPVYALWGGQATVAVAAVGFVWRRRRARKLGPDEGERQDAP
jgi:hypothetical protein